MEDMVMEDMAIVYFDFHPKVIHSSDLEKQATEAIGIKYGGDYQVVEYEILSFANSELKRFIGYMKRVKRNV